MKLFKLSLLTLFLSGLIFQSCNKEEDVIAPELPPTASFSIDFSDFESEGKEVTVYENWGHAAFNVAVWNAIITVGLAVPVASFAEAVNNHEPVYLEDQKWLWEYSFSAGNHNYTAKLYGELGDGEVYWEMYITKEDVFTDFLWYSGTSKLDNSEVDWILYDTPTNPTEILAIDYNKTSEDTGNIKYTNIVPDGPENGGYIKYGNDSTTNLNAYYDIYNKGQDNLIEIEWSQTAKNGRVKNFMYYEDNDWHCWDEYLIDIDCE
ncbi:MAG: hypothetical protein ABFS12_12415 [Bacteroidota bacterium]